MKPSATIITDTQSKRVINYHLSKLFDRLKLRTKCDYVWVNLPEEYLLVDGAFFKEHYSKLKHFELLPTYTEEQLMQIIEAEEMDLPITVEEDSYGSTIYCVNHYKDYDLIELLACAMIDWKEQVSFVGLNAIIDDEYYLFDELIKRPDFVNNNQSLIEAKLEVDKLQLSFMPDDIDLPSMETYRDNWIKAIKSLPLDIKGALEERLRGL